ncbi:MAG TPA: sigma-70 family RNA polymerase sigma factor [Nannocystaceae bacterium]|nr:sigma-70 family RNA polymerase sigma factor [Nannocystaceae bacterium]
MRDDELEQVYREHRGYVRGCLRRAGLGRDALDDAVHDVFAVLVRRRADFDARWSIRQYLAGIARHVARNHRRKTHRPDPGALMQWGSASGAVELRIDLTRELAGLEAAQREAVLESHADGCSAAEIARAHGLPLTTVQYRLRCAHQRLRATLERWREHAAAILAFDLRRLFGPRALTGGFAAGLVSLTVPAAPPQPTPTSSLTMVASTLAPRDETQTHDSPSATSLAVALPRDDEGLDGIVLLGAPRVAKPPITPPSLPTFVTTEVIGPALPPAPIAARSQPPKRPAKPPRAAQRRAAPRPLFPADAIYWVMDDHHVPTRDRS